MINCLCFNSNQFAHNFGGSSDSADAFHFVTFGRALYITATRRAASEQDIFDIYRQLQDDVRAWKRLLNTSADPTGLQQQEHSDRRESCVLYVST